MATSSMKILVGYLTASELGAAPDEVLTSPGAGLYFRSGHAAQVAFSSPGSSRRPIHLAQAAISKCVPLFVESGFELGIGLYADRLHVDMRTEPETWVGTDARNMDGQPMDHTAFAAWVHQARFGKDAKLQPLTLPDCANVQGLAVGEAFPSAQSSLASVCGPVDDQVTRDHPKAFARLSKVLTSNIELAEAPAWYAGYVAPRLDLMLDILSGLVAEHLPGRTVRLLQSWRLGTLPEGAEIEPDDLFWEGRAAVLTLADSDDDGTAGNATSGLAADVATLSRLAVCAGLDYVGRPSASNITVGVLKQKSRLAELHTFELASLLAVDLPWHLSGAADEYADPFAQAGVASLPLFDSLPMLGRPLSLGRAGLLAQQGPAPAARVASALGFKVDDFVSPDGSRYLRLSPHLVHCLQQAEDQVFEELDEALVVLAGYHTASVVAANTTVSEIAGVHLRHQSGFAAEVTVSALVPATAPEAATLDTQDNSALTLPVVRALIDTCGDVAHELGLDMVVGLRQHSVYMDLRARAGDRATSGAIGFVDPAVVNGTSSAEFAATVAEQFAAVPQRIVPFNAKRACSLPSPRRQSPDYVFEPTTLTASDRGPADDGGRRGRRAAPDCTDSATASQFCTATAGLRIEARTEVWDGLVAAGAQWGTKAQTAQASLAQCLDPCDACDEGAVWAAKVKGCSEFMHWSPIAFEGVNQSLFVLDNQDMERLACSTGVCIKSTRLFGLFLQALSKRFQPNPPALEEAEVFGLADNPNPAVGLLQDLFALHVKGHLHVYVADEAELTALHSPLRAALVYNPDVTQVTVHMPVDLADNTTLDNAATALYDFLDLWAGRACPTFARAYWPPIAFQAIPIDGKGSRRRSSDDDRDDAPLGASPDLYPRPDAWEFDGLLG